jgi:hypothetical protein
MTIETAEHPIKLMRHDESTCTDHDEDCEEVGCKVTCWLYDPQRGMCPYLRASSPSSGD